MRWNNYRERLKKRYGPRKGHVNLNQRLGDTLEKNLAAPPTKVTTLAEMSPEKQAAIKALYETRENAR